MTPDLDKKSQESAQKNVKFQSNENVPEELVKEFKERTEELGAFEKYLPLWGALWIIFGIVLSQLIPEIRINENS
ncbi:MAG: hypothetical protein ACOC44_15485 [Promethearchaeia archaeon]